MDLKSYRPKITIPSLRKIFFIIVVSVVFFGTGYYFGLNGYKANTKKFPKVTITREIPVDKTDLDFSLFWKVWDTVSTKYFDKSKLVPGNMIYGAIEGMVAAIGDPYTTFLPPNENKVVQEDLTGSFEGVGIQIGFKGKQLAVITPLPDSPAEKAGVRAGDFIIGIKDEANEIDTGTVGISLPDAVQMIRGKAGSKVTLLLVRDDSSEPLEVEITRERDETPIL